MVRAEDGALFRLDAHRRRLARSLEAIRLHDRVDTEALWDAEAPPPGAALTTAAAP